MFWFTYLSWHIAGFVTKLIVKFQNAQVAYSSPDIAMQVSHMPAISPAREANVATPAWTKLNDEFMSLTASGVYECTSIMPCMTGSTWRDRLLNHCLYLYRL